MKSVLVTGGLGFIGQHTLKPLINLGYKVHVISSRKNLPPPQHNLHYYSFNLLDYAAYLSLIKDLKPSHLLHMAWYTENGKFWDSPLNNEWIDLTYYLVENFITKSSIKILCIGTCAEYNYQTIDVCQENTPQKLPKTLYGQAKLTTYQRLKSLTEIKNKNFAWARIFFPFGPHEDSKRLIPYVVNKLIHNEVAYCTHGNQIRDFLHVSDIGHALALLLDSNVNGIVNICSGEPITIKSIVTKIGELMKKENLLDFGSIQDQVHSPPKIVGDNSRLINEVGWRAKFNLQEGLLNTIDWWQKFKGFAYENRN